MAKFKLKEATWKIRDMEVTVRELSQKEANQFSAAVVEDKGRGPATIASLGCIDPKMTEEEWSEESPLVLNEIVTKIIELSGMAKKDETESSVVKH
jgi:hypothetical protein